MARKKSDLGDLDATSAPSVPDCSPAKIAVTTLPAGTELHRVHHVRFAGDSFNPHPHSNARFSTLVDDSGAVVPTLYVASTFGGALMETLFHDVPYGAGDKFIDSDKLERSIHSCVTTTIDITLADLTTKPLRKLGVPPEQLVTSNKSDYAFSRAVAREIYTKNPDIQGLRWVSRQDNTSYAYILFGTRFSTSPLNVALSCRSLNNEALNDVLDVAEEIGVLIVPGKAI